MLDGIAIVPVDVEFDLIWRSGSADTTLAYVPDGDAGDPNITLPR